MQRRRFLALAAGSLLLGGAPASADTSAPAGVSENVAVRPTILPLAPRVVPPPPAAKPARPKPVARPKRPLREAIVEDDGDEEETTTTPAEVSEVKPKATPAAGDDKPATQELTPPKSKAAPAAPPAPERQPAAENPRPAAEEATQEARPNPFD